MPDYRHDLMFGVFVTPLAAQAEGVVELARLADVLGLDLVTFQDHPYQPRFLDTWTLLSVVGAQTANVRIAPNVANVPLRQPAVLAKSAASLDILTGGRVELGLGAGSFWDAIAAMGGPRLTPGQSVDALSEAIDVIRAVWTANGDRVDYRGAYHTLHGAHPGPPPAHDIEIWLGAYRRRMLRLTGEKADGWLPSESYLELERLSEMNASIDEAAAAAGRRAEDIRRLMNLAGPAEPQRLAELTLSTGTSAYILAVSSADDVRRFAEDVAPATRDLVADARGAAEPPTPPAQVAIEDRSALAARPTPVPERLTGETVWDESTRPTGPARDPARTYTPREQAAGQHLIDVHDALRAELAQLRDLVEQVAAGTSDPQAVRSFINRMTIRQNNWTLGTFCETYCRVVTSHHTLEDRSVFPHLRRSDTDLGPVIDRLEEEHEQIADLLERVDRALVALVAEDDGGIGGVGRAMDLLTDALLSHFSYEERELVEPLARHGFY
jgi:alkanesulfonate monooxygenase SsuD/methylene tetrahydromethanopterin reductase-like flavin-dependent oxidoreductase (luciferase family)